MVQSATSAEHSAVVHTAVVADAGSTAIAVVAGANWESHTAARENMLAVAAATEGYNPYGTHSPQAGR